MKPPLICLLLLWAALLPDGMKGQHTFKDTQQSNLSILKNGVLSAKSDTTCIQLRYRIGREMPVERAGYWDSLVSDAHRHHLVRLEAVSTQILGHLYLLMGRQDKACNCCMQSYDLAEKNRDTSTMFLSLICLSRVFYTNHDIKRALDYCYKGLKMAEEKHDTLNMANFYMEEALCDFATGEFHHAIALHLKSLKIYEHYKNDEGCVNCLMGLGTDYHAMKHDDIAGRYYLQCKKYAGFFGNSSLAIDIYNSVGAGYNMLYQADSAFKYCHRAYEIALRNNFKIRILGTITSLSGVCYRTGDLKRAQLYGESADSMLKTVNFKLQDEEIAENLQQIYYKQGNYKKAFEAQRRFMQAKDSLTSEANRRQALDREINYNLAKKEHENQLLTKQSQIKSLQLWAMATVIAMILAVAWLLFKQSRIKNEQENALLEQKLLRLQMNPHFFFNSLQAIQFFVMNGEKIQAGVYLGAFAGVMRNVLENSRMELIPLKKEISLLENYLQLQKLRFYDRFDYEIKADEHIDPEQVSVPPMLAQPFIENAVEHGFHTIVSGGKIRIAYTVKNETLIMEITDNGIGMKDGYSQNKNHQSLAIEITRERIALLNKKSKGKAHFSITEAFPLQENKGVKVNFTLPLH